MISFLKFKNKNTEQKTPERSEPTIRSRKSSNIDPEQDLLIENPEVQKARHRLLGAGFLLLVAVIGLPRIFDSQPKNIKNDVALQVVTSVTESASPKPSEISPKPEDQPTSYTQPTANTEQSSTETVIEQSKPVAKLDQPELKKSTPAPQTIEEVISDSIAKVDTDKPKSKFYIQVATFSSNDGVKKMSSKLKSLKISSYVVERKKDPDSTLYQVRAGPFTSKEDAQAAMDKMSGLDVNPKIIEIKK